MTKIGKSFKEYYTDPEYKAKHNKYMCEKVKCTCGCDVIRAYMTKHKQTKKHLTMIVTKNQDNIKDDYETKLFDCLYTQINTLMSKTKKKELIKLLKTNIKK